MLNHAVLMGRLTADPEVSYTPNNTMVAHATLAVERNFTPKGQERKADFLNLIAWKQQAEFLSKYFRKGQLIAVEGAIQTESYTDNQGVKRKKFEILVERIHFAEPKRQTADAPTPAYSNGPEPQSTAQNSQPAAAQAAYEMPSYPQGPYTQALEAAAPIDQEQLEDLLF